MRYLASRYRVMLNSIIFLRENDCARDWDRDSCLMNQWRYWEEVLVHFRRIFQWFRGAQVSFDECSASLLKHYVQSDSLTALSKRLGQSYNYKLKWIPALSSKVSVDIFGEVEWVITCHEVIDNMLSTDRQTQNLCKRSADQDWMNNFWESSPSVNIYLVLTISLKKHSMACECCPWIILTSLESK